MAALKRRVIPYGLLLPGTAWLIVFFLIPLYFMGKLSLNVNLGTYYPFDWHWQNYSDALSLYDTQFFRSFLYSGLATLICLLLAYPLAYTIAFKAGKWRHAMLLAVVAPFFTTYLIRTISWVTILSDESPVVDVLNFLQLAPGAAWLILFFLVPLYFMGKLSLNVNLGTYYPFDWHWQNYSDALSLYDTQFIRSFVYSLAATLICLLLAYPLAYMIAFKAGKWRHAMLLAVVAPFFTTYLIRTISWVTILSDESPVVDVLKFLQIAPSGRVLATGPAVVAGLVYNYLPFMVLPIYASLERLDTRLMEAAKDLYADTKTTFLKVTLPLSAPGVVAGTLLTFIPATGDYVNAQFLGGSNNQMIGNVIQSLYLNQRDYPEAAALSFLMMALILAVVVVYIRFAGTGAFMGDEDEESA